MSNELFEIGEVVMHDGKDAGIQRWQPHPVVLWRGGSWASIPPVGTKLFADRAALQFQVDRLEAINDRNPQKSASLPAQQLREVLNKGGE